MYTDNKSYDLEERVETVLAKHELSWIKSEAYIPKEKMLDKFAVLNVAPILSEAIKRINKDMPISAMILE